MFCFVLGLFLCSTLAIIVIMFPKFNDIGNTERKIFIEESNDSKDKVDSKISESTVAAESKRLNKIAENEEGEIETVTVTKSADLVENFRL